MDISGITITWSVLLLSVVRHTSSEKLLLFLVDGFRWDYFDLPGVRLTGFPRLFREGTRAEWIIPAFPTNSLPNYKTLETGLYVESHGMVGNYMWDEHADRYFEMSMVKESTLYPDWWNQAESFFITAEKQGIRTGLFHVCGCDVIIHGTRPTYCLPYVSSGPTKESTTDSIRQAFGMMRHGNVEIAYIYHQSVDSKGHRYGPNSQEVKAAVEEVDGHINEILNVMEEFGQHDVNVIVVSDHGMSSVDQLHMINISSVLNMEDIREITEGGTQAYIWPVPGREEHIYNSLKSYSSHLHVFYRHDIMERWFFKQHSLIPPIFLTAEKGWYIVHPKSGDTYFESMGIVWKGNHGYDNANLDMRSIFVAKGPAFKKNHVIKAFNNVNIYQMICHVTGISANPHNGTWSDVEDAFVPYHKKTDL